MINKKEIKELKKKFSLTISKSRERNTEVFNHMIHLFETNIFFVRYFCIIETFNIMKT